MSADLTSEVRAHWDAAAAVYEGAITPALADGHRALLALAGPLDGRDVLEVGCGTGAVSARMAAAGARVTAVDLSPEMAAAARARPGLEGARVEVMDAQALDLPDEAFDAVVAPFSLMFCPRPDRALAEAGRVLRPGGRLALSVWGLPEECETVEVGRVAAGFSEGPAPETPTPQALGDPVRLEALVREAGFRDPSLRSRVISLRYPSPDALWRAFLVIHGSRIPEARRPEARRATLARLAEIGLPLRNRAWLATGVRPED